jgi:hypothetical protein
MRGLNHQPLPCCTHVIDTCADVGSQLLAWALFIEPDDGFMPLLLI